MSDLQDKLNALVAAAKSEGIDLPSLAPMLADAWNADIPAAWDSSGMSKPDESGLVRFKALQDLKAQLAQEGYTAAADAIRDRFACIPGLRLCAADSAGAAAVLVATSTASFYQGMGIVGGWNFYPAVPTGDPLGPKFKSDRTHVIPDAYSVPKEQDTPQKVVDYITAIAKRFE